MNPGAPRLKLLGLTLLVGLPAGHVWSQPTVAPAASSAIYSCVDDKGRRLTSDRPIVDCLTRDQRLLNRDGSLKKIQSPTLTAEERAERDQADRRAVEARTAQADAVRRDRNLIARFPNEAAHRKAREASLDTVRVAMKNSAARLNELAAERKPLMAEMEFYIGKAPPAHLRQQLDANDAGVAAQRDAIQSQEAELVRVNKLYDEELARMRRLWASTASASPAVQPSTPITK